MRRTAACLLLLAAVSAASAQKEFGFDNAKPSGQPYLTPEETVRRMKVPDGFEVQLFAGEPMLTNPIAFTVDERGRVWVIESFEYPKRTPAGQMPRDRIVILEDTDGDGKADKRTVFAEGKDFPKRFDLASGIEVGYGGCFLGAPPYLWHLKDTDGDGKADRFDILLEGFGSQDTHETLNTFTWGPDGWLYGLHGVFTHSKVGEPGASATGERAAPKTPVAHAPGSPAAAPGSPPVEIDAGVWRYHPKRKKFEQFAEGTSNPWGMDFDRNGNLFICCCVIPHLFHIVPGGIYRRQAGASKNPYAYGELKEICDHTFHKESGWAHAGLLSLDTPAMPEEFRTSVIFGSIHGNSLKRNTLRPNGSTFTASKAPDFLTCGDKNFRPVGLRWGPAGSIFVSDWHDQNPCHQAKPESWDYERGRIYVLRPKAKTSDDPLKRYREREKAIEATPPFASREKENDAHDYLRMASSFARGEPNDGGRSGVRVLLKHVEATDDPVLPFMLWLAYERQVFAKPDRLDAEIAWLAEYAPSRPLMLQHIVPRFFRRLVAHVAAKPAFDLKALALVSPPQVSDSSYRIAALRGLVAGFREHPKLDKFHDADFSPLIAKAQGEERELLETLELLLDGPAGRAKALKLLTDAAAKPEQRFTAIQQLGQAKAKEAFEPLLELAAGATPHRQAALHALSHFPNDDLARRLLPLWKDAPPEIKRQLIQFAASRKPWAKDLLRAVAAGRIPRTELHDSAILGLRQFNDPELDDLIEKHWGRIRTSPADIAELIDGWRPKLAKLPGDAAKGKLVFAKHCAACHRYDGEGHEVAPALDGADRSPEYLLINILDPNRVVGLPYQARLVLLKNGRLETGLLHAEDADSLTLKKEKADLVRIPKSAIEEMKTSEKSLMPEGLGKQMGEQEFRDLIEYLRRK